MHEQDSAVVSAIRVVLIEDNASYAAMLANYFRHPSSGVEWLAVYASAEAALENVSAAAAQVALVDINLPGMSGIECISRIREMAPNIQCVVLTTFEEDGLIFEALKAGACGYLLKRSSPDELTQAIQQAAAGGAPMSPQIARQVVGYFHTLPSQKVDNTLSPRENEIIGLLAGGLLYKEIAERLDLKFETVRSYVKKIYEKLHAHSRTEAVLKWRGK